jgi:long-chain fatty acid transport protein
LNRRIRLGIFVLSILFVSTFGAANGLNLNGLGSRAIAMGGAFTGLADDFSAIYWNPAGMAQIDQKTFGVYGFNILSSMTYKFDFFGMNLVNARTQSKAYQGGLAAYCHPISDKLVFGVSAYSPAGLGANWDGDDFAMISAPGINWNSQVGMLTFAPGLAYKVSDALMIGASLNVNYAMFDMNSYAGGDPVDLGQNTMSYTGWGFGATLGILIKPGSKFSAGLTFRTPVNVTFMGDTTISKLNVLGQIPGSPLSGADIPTVSETEVEVTWPMYLAFGLAYKPIDNLTLTADVQYTNWKKIDELTLQYTDPIWQAILVPLGGDKFPLHWNNATQIRFGGEYRLTEQFALQAGYYIDPAPAPDSTMNVLLPSFDFTGVSLGVRYAMNGLTLNFAMEYLKGKDREILLDLTGQQESMPGLYTMKIFVPTISVGYSWGNK